MGRSRLVIIRGAGRPDHSNSISPIQAGPMPAIAAAFDKPSVEAAASPSAPWPMMPVSRAPGVLPDTVQVIPHVAARARAYR